jgi:hypothetical protein
MKKLNCWEFQECRREKSDGNGKKGRKCLVPDMVMYDGVHGGKNAGRVCWLVPDTSCHGDRQITFSHKLTSCVDCAFYKMVQDEEGSELEMPMKILEDLMARVR